MTKRRAAHPAVDFFPVHGQDVRPAKAVCSICAVRLECLTHCFAMGEHYGIWGGLSERERRRIRVRRGMRVRQPAA
jgi:WhiB family redox-sensing transcriptional regulator